MARFKDKAACTLRAYTEKNIQGVIKKLRQKGVTRVVRSRGTKIVQNDHLRHFLLVYDKYHSCNRLYYDSKVIALVFTVRLVRFDNLAITIKFCVFSH